MTTFEIISAVISLATLITVIVGLAYGFFQLRNATNQLVEVRRIHADDHEWRRRNAAQKALREYSYSLLSSPLQQVFDYLNCDEPIPLEKIQAEFSGNAELQPNLHQLLNFYEGLARGIKHGLFDESIIKAARKNAMIMATRGFQNYINDRRKRVNLYAWTDLSSVITEWIQADNYVTPRVMTGV